MKEARIFIFVFLPPVRYSRLIWFWSGSNMHPAASCAIKRLKALIKTLVEIKGIYIACVGKRIKTANVYTYGETHLDEILSALKPSNHVKHFHEDDININRKNIIIKENDGPMYLADQYVCSTIEKKMKSRPGGICRHVIYLKYDDTTNIFTETRRTGNKVEGRKKTECETCINQHLECETACRKNVYPLIDVMYNSPLIRERESSNQNVLHGSERSISSHDLQYLTKHPLFCEYTTRLSTFRNWQHFLDPKILAENGFFYQGVGDTVTCHFCGIALMHWGPDDDALLEHLKYSPDCGYLLKSLGTGTIQQYLDQRKNDVTAGAYSISNPVQQSLRSSAEIFVHNCRTPRSPSYQSFGARVSSFAKFPNYNDINIQDIANAGFYYTGVDDMVRCYWCDLSLKEWEFGDDPYIEHAKYVPDCNHLMTTKGKQFITHIQRSYDQNLQEVKIPASPVKVSGAAGGEKERDHARHNAVKAWPFELERETKKQINMIDVLDTPAAESVLEHGYSKEIVLAAIRKLKSNDQSFPTAMQILDVIFNAEENGVDLLTQDLIRLDIQKAEVVKGSKDDESIKLLAENHRLKSIMICKQCQARDRTMLFLPCSHRNLCDICAKETDVCPECQQQIKQKVKTYMS
ncbi:hypothetical protein CHS0354_034265 [Potamilus streckersoni]|uniref:RING-type domain-containing protein n=1 Tax=Potamilus streckersoni TaxID=2493646 RepID=A0AAE0VPF8_9BIVA|nr:hypothetical protein CHS0354_034265 [Potamilus streckersoni]